MKHPINRQLEIAVDGINDDDGISVQCTTIFAAAAISSRIRNQHASHAMAVFFLLRLAVKSLLKI